MMKATATILKRLTRTTKTIKAKGTTTSIKTTTTGKIISSSIMGAVGTMTKLATTTPMLATLISMRVVTTTAINKAIKTNITMTSTMTKVHQLLVSSLPTGTVAMGQDRDAAVTILRKSPRLSVISP